MNEKPRRPFSQQSDNDRRRFAAMRKDMPGTSSGEFVAEEPSELLTHEEVGFGGYERPERARPLGGARVAVVIADGFEQAEFDGPVQALKNAGATVEVIAQDREHLGHIRGLNEFDGAAGAVGNRVIDQVTADDFDALLIPGGLASTDFMRQSPPHLALVRASVTANKPVGALCHGALLLADAQTLTGRRVTSAPGCRRDLERAGAQWIDEAVVQDGNLVTSRQSVDVPTFTERLMALIAATQTGSKEGI